MLHHASFGVSNIEKSYTFYDAFFRAGAGSSAGAGHHLAFRSKSRSSQTISSGCLGARGSTTSRLLLPPIQAPGCMVSANAGAPRTIRVDNFKDHCGRNTFMRLRFSTTDLRRRFVTWRILDDNVAPTLPCQLIG